MFVGELDVEWEMWGLYPSSRRLMFGRSGELEEQPDRSKSCVGDK